MTRLEELTLNLADEALTERESQELDTLLRTDPAREHYLAILQIEAGLRGTRQKLDLGPAIMAQLRAQRENALTERVMSEIKDNPLPSWQRGDRFQRNKSSSTFSLSEILQRVGGLVAGMLRPRAVWASLTAAFALLLFGALIWLFGPAVGPPVLANVSGEGASLERKGQFLPAAAGMALKSGDVLRTRPSGTAVIDFSPERTSITVQPGTDLQLGAISGAKVFDLRFGKVEVTAAKQRPFHAMQTITPYALAHVLGTKFTLNVSSNATRLEVVEGKVRFTRLRDLQAVRVPAGHYAVAAADYELSALPMTGGIRRELWGGVSGKNLYDLQRDLRFPDHPDGWDLAHSFELAPVETNHLGVRFRGYLHPPVTGDYEFWLAGATDAQLLMSPTERDDDRACIARNKSHAKTWDSPRFQGESQWSPPVPLVAGRRYYIEALLLIERGEGHLSVAWKGPGRPRELLTADFLSPVTPKK